MNGEQRTLTFLFTAIEGAARLWDGQAQAMTGALARHHAILQQVISTGGGHVFQVVGDEFCVAFEQITPALRTVVAAQYALLAEDWAVVGGLRVKMALHVGLAELRGSDYYASPTLNRLARTLAVTHGSQILVTAATREGVHGYLPEGYALRDLGERKLRDLPPEHLYQLVAPGLADSFPPLPTLDARPHNLPAQLTTLIGREAETATLRSSLRQTRLLTLTGPGGAGKTRLSLAVAATLLDEFADGVYFVPLAPVSDVGLVASTIASTLGVKETAGQSATNALQSYLQGKQMLLVLDNFEQVVEAAPILNGLLTASPRLKLLVSSREVLHLYGEQEYAVPPLALPDLKRLPPSSELERYAAIALFVARANAGRPDFHLSAENAAAVAEICTRLDGLPLAIELAAARIKLLTPRQMVERLASRLALLNSGNRNPDPRQRSLREAIAWSYDLLGAEEQSLFRRLAVFVGGCTAEAAFAICNCDGSLPFDVLGGLASLVDKSLLRSAEERDGSLRFQMLETVREYALEKLTGNESRYDMQKAVREYALEQLAESGESATLRTAHTAYYVAFAETADQQLRGRELAHWIVRVEAEHDNLRAALQWTLATEAPLALRLATALGYFWMIRGYYSEGRQWLEVARAQDRQTTIMQAAALNALGNIVRMQGEYSAARTCFEQSIAMGEELANQRTIATALGSLANLISEQGDNNIASLMLQEALTIWQSLADEPKIASTLGRIGTVAFYRGDLDTAARLIAESVVAWRKIGDVITAARMLDNQGVVELERGSAAGAFAAWAESLIIYRALDDKVNIAFTLNNAGDLLRRQGDYEQAKALLNEALTIRQELGAKLDVARTTNNLAQVILEEGGYQQAEELFERCLHLFHEAGVMRDIAAVFERLTRVEIAKQDYERATHLLAAAAALREASDNPVLGSQREEYDRTMAALHQALDAERYAVAWVVGKAMTLEEAVAYASNGGKTRRG